MFTARVASARQRGYIELRLGGLDGKLMGTCKADGTGGLQEWKNAAGGISAATDVQDLYMKVIGSETEKLLFNLNYWRFE